MSDAEELSGIRQLVTFKIGDEEFGVDILKVQEIIRPVEVTKLPMSRPYFEGIICLRGAVIPILDLRIRLGLSSREQDKNTRILIVESNISESSRTVETIEGTSCQKMGYRVDSVSEVLRIPSEAVEMPPDVLQSTEASFIKGVGKLGDRLLMLIDLDASFHASEQPPQASDNPLKT
jgi:purine-binding chemotaxis protein CheW